MRDRQIQPHEISEEARAILLLLGEKAGMREGVNTISTQLVASLAGFKCCQGNEWQRNVFGFIPLPSFPLARIQLGKPA